MKILCILLSLNQIASLIFFPSLQLRANSQFPASMCGLKSLGTLSFINISMDRVGICSHTGLVGTTPCHHLQLTHFAPCSLDIVCSCPSYHNLPLFRPLLGSPIFYLIIRRSSGPFTLLIWMRHSRFIPLIIPSLIPISGSTGRFMGFFPSLPNAQRLLAQWTYAFKTFNQKSVLYFQPLSSTVLSTRSSQSNSNRM